MVNDESIRNFYKEICQNLEGNYKIVLEPERDLKEDWIEYDSVKWEIESNVKEVVEKLQKDVNKSLEEKIFELYKYICMHYIYDANVLYFFKRDDSNPNNIKYIAADWYGRIVDFKWFENRQKHNRRICYEFSRFYAKAINLLINDRDDLEAMIVGDKENTHYVVGLTGKNYSIILDQDDFSNIKDLTRIKMNLTLKGIHIFRDNTGKFIQLVNSYNSDKLEELKEITEARVKYKDIDKIKFLNLSIDAINKYDIDSQGFFEYIRSLIEEIEINIEKIWRVDTRNTIERRHERCLYFDYDGKTYLLDSIEKTLKIINLDELDKNIFIFKPEENEYKYFGC